MSAGRDLLEKLGAITAPAREIRHRPDEDFADVDADELTIAARNLRAIGYSCTEGARKLEWLARSRA